MFRLFIIFFLSLQIFPYLQAQNLVYNPSFEEIHCLESCSNGIVNHKLIANHWWTATESSPDIFSPCNILIDSSDSIIICNSWGSPQNWLGYQFPHSGQNYAGYFSGGIFLKDSVISDNWKEFPEASLKESLKKDVKYCTSFYLAQATDKIFKNSEENDLFMYALTDKTGIYFSKTRLYVPTMGAPPVIPQVILKSDSNTYIGDTLFWERLYAPYIAEGGEQYMTIGNFTPPDQMILHIRTNMTPSFIETHTDAAFCIHYIDDIEVIEIPELEAKADTHTIYKGDSVWLYSPTQAEEYTWFAGDTLDKIGSGDSLRVNPIETTTYWLKALQCKLTSYDTVTITVLPAPLIPVNVSVINTLASNDFTIKYTGDNRPELQAELFNSVGQIVRRFVFTETMNVGISDLATGIYYCRIRKDNVPVLTQKIVKMR